MSAVPTKLPITLILLSYNEEIHHGALSVAASPPWVERVVLIDSFSTRRDGGDRAEATAPKCCSIRSRTTPTSSAGAWQPPRRRPIG